MLTVITYLLLVVEVVCSILLIGVILLQKSKSSGAGLAFGAGMGETLFGSQVGNVLTRTTVILAIVFLVNTTLLSVLGAMRKTGSVADSVRPAPLAPASPYVPPAPVESAGPVGDLPPLPADTGAADMPAPGVAEPVAAPPSPGAMEPAEARVVPVLPVPVEGPAGDDQPVE